MKKIFLRTSIVWILPFQELLVKNLGDAKSSLEKLGDDIDYLRDQITTTEVNMARIYNWNVKNKKANGEPLQRMGS